MVKTGFEPKHSDTRACTIKLIECNRSLSNPRREVKVNDHSSPGTEASQGLLDKEGMVW